MYMRIQVLVSMCVSCKPLALIDPMILLHAWRRVLRVWVVHRVAVGVLRLVGVPRLVGVLRVLCIGDHDFLPLRVHNSAAQGA